MRLTKEEINFLIECLEWNKYNYGEKATKYSHIEGYKEKISLPTIKKMNDIIDKLKSEKAKRKN